MPFTAYEVSETGAKKLVCVLNRDRNAAPLGGKRFVCPECGGPMHFRNPSVKRPHFYHHSVADGTTCSLSEAETPQHVAGKYLIAVDLPRSKQYAGRVKEVHVEYPIGNRRADVAYEMNDGGLEVFEVQLSPTNPAELAKRTEDYYASGATGVNWFIGGGADTRENRAYVESVCGECIIISFRTENVSISVI